MNTVMCMDCARELRTMIDVGERRVLCRRCHDIRIEGSPTQRVMALRKQGLRHCVICNGDKPKEEFPPSSHWKDRVYSKNTCRECVEDGKGLPSKRIPKAKTTGLPAHWRI